MVHGSASRFAWAFNDPAFSDVQLVLRATKSHGDFGNTSASSINFYDCRRRGPSLGSDQRDANFHTPRRGCERTATPFVPCQREAKHASHLLIGTAQGGKGCHPRPQRMEIRIHAHSIILASCSEMMRSWLSRWSEEHPEEDGDTGELDGVARAQRERRRRRLALRLDVDLSPEELSAGEAVVRFMYTQSLDGVEDDEELLECMLLADRWLLPDCVAACAARLQSTPAGSLSWRVRAALLALPLGLSAASPHVAQLQARAEASMMRTFRCPELVLEDADNRLLLLSLPPDRMEQLLLARQDLQVTSENVVLALLSAWLEHNYPHLEAGHCPGGGCAERGAACWGHVVGEEEQRDVLVGGSAAAAATGGEGVGGPVGARAGPPEVEALLRLVRYTDLTPHYRTAVAPSLTVLRGLRLHHLLLAEAAATSGCWPLATAAASYPPAGERPVPLRQSSVDSDTDTAAAATPEVTKQAPAAGSGSMDLSRASSMEKADSAGKSAASGNATHGSRDLKDSGRGSCCGAADATGSTTETAFRRSSSGMASEQLGFVEESDRGGAEEVALALSTGKNQGSGSCSGGHGCSSAAAAAAAKAAELARSGKAANVTASGSSAAVHAATGGGAAAAAVAAAAPPAAAAALASAPPPAMLDPSRPAPTEEPLAQPLAVPRLPRRLPYSSFRRIEWTRDIRDVRLHLTGVGGPMLGGEAAAGHQLSPPVFLGGYNWHVATRFVPAAATPLGAVPGAVTTHYDAATAGGPASSSGRLQLQLGVVCTAPGAEGLETGTGVAPLLDIQLQQQQWRQKHLQQPQGSGTASGYKYGGAPEVDMTDVMAAGDLPLSVASCTVGVVDAAGRPAWQVVQAPCNLKPGRASSGSSSGGLSSSGAQDGASGPPRGWGRCSPPARWEFWSGLTGLEPSWWESGSALTAGGVLRMYCSLTLQA